jgi:NDP-sugar pyrophosphorylase family protein
VGRQTQIEEDARLQGSIIWPNCRISREADVRDAIVGKNSHLGRNVTLEPGAVLGDRTTLTDYSKA